MSGVLDAHLSGRRLSAFVDGELMGCEADRWRGHLLRCAMCTAAVAAERGVRERMRGAAAPVPSSDLLASLRVVAADALPHSGLAQSGLLPTATRGHEGALPTGWRRSGRVVGAVMVTTSTVAAAAVVGLGVWGAGQDGSYPAGPAALPTAIDSRPADPAYVPAGFGAPARAVTPTSGAMPLVYQGLTGSAPTGTTGR